MTDATALQKPTRKPPAVTCGAKTRSGHPCKRAPTKGKVRCRLHGGVDGVGAPLENTNAQKHGMRAGDFRGYFQRAKEAALEAINQAEATQDPLKAADVARTLAVDARRLMAGVLMVEKRVSELEAKGKLDARAQDAAHRALMDYERILAKVRGAQVNLVNHFGISGDEDEEITVHLAVPAGVSTVTFMAGARAELPEGQTPALPAPDDPVVDVEGGSVGR